MDTSAIAELSSATPMAQGVARLQVALGNAEERERCGRVLREAGYHVSLSGEGGPGERGGEPPHLLLIDVAGLERLRAGDGAGSPLPPLLVLADYDEVEQAGLRDPYVLRPLQPRELLLQVGLALQRLGFASPGAAELAGVRFRRKSDRLIGQSQAITSLYDRIALVAQSDVPVLILGESGTGKELVARAIHWTSRRCQRPFVAINCGSIPEPLLEDELFGHVRGAFTDARAERPGIFEQAAGGTVFLDEITELPASGQVKLLRVLQEREVRRVGGTQAIEVDVRVLAASNRDLQEALRDGSLREDLFYRLNVFTLSLPPLRERVEDIPLLVAHFIVQFSPEAGQRVRGISAPALERLQSYRWPGNVRELENVIRQAMLLCRGEEIQEGDLVLPDETTSPGFPTFKEAKRRFERDYIRQAMERAGGNVTRAARLAGKDRKDFYDLLRRHGVSPEQYRQGRPPR
jgi:two-component system response regulator GlrR